MTNRNLSFAAAVALGAASPAFATTAAAAPPAKPAPAAQGTQSITRAAVVANRDAVFKKIDTNGDGSISAAELANAEAAIGRARLDAEFTRLDTNKDGQLSKAEFLAAAPPASALMQASAKTVAALDKNHDGKVTPDEFRAPQLAGFDKLDTNHDGTLSPTERQAAQAAAQRK